MIIFNREKQEEKKILIIIVADEEVYNLLLKKKIFLNFRKKCLIFDYIVMKCFKC